MYLKNLNKRGLFYVLIAAIISGVSIFINSFGVKGIDSTIFTFSKNIIVSVFLFSIILFFGKFIELKKLSKKNWLQLVSIGFIGGSIPFILFFKGLQITSGATSGFIHKTMFIYVTIFAFLFLKEKLTKGLFIGAIFLLIGTYFLINPEFSFNFGHLYILIATLFWAIENTLSKYVLKNIRASVVAFGRMFFGSLFILIYLVFTNKTPLLLILTFSQFIWIIITSIFLLSYVVVFYSGLRNIKVTTATMILTIAAPITTILDIIFKNKLPSMAQTLGIILILLGFVSVVWFRKISLSLIKIFGKKQYERT